MAQQTDERAPDERRHHDAGPAPEPDRLKRWERAIAARRQLLRRVGFALSLTIVLVSAIIFIRVLVRINLGQFQAAFAATGGDQIAMAFGLSALSYIALTGYDALALRHLRVRVPYRLTALASFTSYAVSFTLGFPLVTGGAVRYWIYCPRRAFRRQGREPHRRRRHHLLARHGLHHRRRFPVRRDGDRRDQPLSRLGQPG